MVVGGFKTFRICWVGSRQETDLFCFDSAVVKLEAKVIA